jgi:hypothetical protein
MEELIEYLDIGMMYRVENAPRRVRIYHTSGYIIVAWSDAERNFTASAFIGESEQGKFYNVRSHGKALDAYLNVLHSGPFFGSLNTSHFIGGIL